MKLNQTVRTLALFPLLLSILIPQPSTSFAQGTAFTYQGRLNDGANPASGVYDLRFAVYDAAGGGALVAGPVTNSPIAISNGLFAVTLDFGPGVFTGEERWLEIAVRPGPSPGAYTNLVPRQPLNATPYAVRAANFSGPVADTQLSGNIARLNANQTFSGAVGFSSPLNNFTGNGGGLSNLAVNSLVRTTTNFSVVGWGYNGNGEISFPAGLNNVVGVVAGGFHGLALRSDGTIVGWGYPLAATVPAGLNGVSAITAGFEHSVAVKTNGQVVVWGSSLSGQTNGLANWNNVVAVAAGNYHTLALKSDGTVLAWGRNEDGQTNIPAGLGNVTAVANGAYFGLALKNDGTVVAWGAAPIVPVGLSNVVAIAGGGGHALALKSDGTVVAWGENFFGQATVPAGLSNAVAVAAGYQYSLALKADGSVVGWGSTQFDVSTPPLGLNSVIALAPAPSAFHALAIRRQAHSPVAWLAEDNSFDGNVRFNGVSSFNGPIEFNGAIEGKVGIGTTEPEQPLHVVVNAGEGEGIRIDSAIAGHAPAIYLNHTGNNGHNFRLASYGDNVNGGSFRIYDDTFDQDVFVIDENGVLSGNGEGLTSLNASNVSNGTLADARLSANVALRGGGNNFTGNQTIDGKLGIGLSAPVFPLDVQSGQAVGRFTTTNNGNGAVLSLRNITASPTYLGAINFEDNTTPGQIGYLASGQMIFRVGNVERMNLQAGGLYVNGAIVLTSDRNAKEDIVPLDAQAVLEKVVALPLQSWSYTNRPGVKHVGPMAQDFHAAFGLGEDDKYIATVDADGVALAAIQGLNEKVEVRNRRSDDRMQKLETENADLKKELANLKGMVERLAQPRKEH